MHPRGAARSGRFDVVRRRSSGCSVAWPRQVLRQRLARRADNPTERDAQGGGRRPHCHLLRRGQQLDCAEVWLPPWFRELGCFGSGGLRNALPLRCGAGGGRHELALAAPRADLRQPLCVLNRRSHGTGVSCWCLIWAGLWKTVSLLEPNFANRATRIPIFTESLGRSTIWMLPSPWLLSSHQLSVHHGCMCRSIVERFKDRPNDTWTSFDNGPTVGLWGVRGGYEIVDCDLFGAYLSSRIWGQRMGSEGSRLAESERGVWVWLNRHSRSITKTRAATGKGASSSSDSRSHRFSAPGKE